MHHCDRSILRRSVGELNEGLERLFVKHRVIPDGGADTPRIQGHGLDPVGAQAALQLIGKQAARQLGVQVGACVGWEERQIGRGGR